jgi:hypothetical protein
MTRRRVTPRKLLIASVGVATLNYLGAAPTACGGTVVEEGKNTDGTGATAGAGGSGGAGGVPAAGGNVGNLMPPPSPTVANLMAPPIVTVTPPPFPTVANLMAPPLPTTVPPPFPTVANLMAPPPPPPVKDASSDVDAGNTKDGGKPVSTSPKDATID